jgi:AcrR family transcriptional regulator
MSSAKTQLNTKAQPRTRTQPRLAPESAALSDNSVGPGAAKIRILEAAHSLMQQGSTHASMVEIAQAAGISRQAVYMHFGTREALLSALNEYMAQTCGIAGELQRIHEAKTGIEALRMSASFQARLYPKVRAVVRALERAQGNNDEAADRVWQAQLRSDLAGCKDTVNRLDREQLLKPGLDVATGTDLLWALTSIPLWEELVLQRGWSAKRYERHVAELLIAALIDPAKRPAQQTDD